MKQLPTNFLDALRCLETNEVLSKALGTAFITAYLKLKRQMWNDYSAHISAWELENTLDC